MSPQNFRFYGNPTSIVTAYTSDIGGSRDQHRFPNSNSIIVEFKSSIVAFLHHLGYSSQPSQLSLRVYPLRPTIIIVIIIITIVIR